MCHKPFRFKRLGEIGLSLTELLAVTLICLLIASLLLGAIRVARETARSADCVHRLHALGFVFEQYQEEYGLYPTFGPSPGLGDRYNWYDLYGFSDMMGQSFIAMDFNGNGIAEGNETQFPRVPRLLADYTEGWEPLICPSQGESAFWYDLGPYFYNVTLPWPLDGVGDLYEPKAPMRGNKLCEPLAACQSPVQAQLGMACWRHGDRLPRAPGGINNTLFLDQSVKGLRNPGNWTWTP